MLLEALSSNFLIDFVISHFNPLKKVKEAHHLCEHLHGVVWMRKLEFSLV